MARSLKVVLASTGSRGDVQPMLALAQALAARGHVPLVAAPPDFADWVAGLGFAFAPLGRPVQSWLQQHPASLTGNPLTVLREGAGWLREHMNEQAVQLCSLAAGADCMVYGGLTLAVAPSVAERLGLPAIRLHYTTAVVPADSYPPASIPWRGLPRWLNRLLWAAERRLGQRALLPMLNAMRADLQLPPAADVWAHMVGSFAAFNTVDAGVFPPSASWQQPLPRYSNFLYMQDPRPLEPELDAWLRDGPAPVYVGFGSMLGAGTDRVGRMVVDGVQATGMRCLVGAGWAGLGAGPLPSGWRVVGDAPHALLFPRMAVVVHHGGSGTTGQALRAGVPQVVLPLLLDQYHHAHLLHKAGLAPRPVRMEKVTAPQLTDAIAQALALPAGPRDAVAARLRASDGCAPIVECVEQLAARQP